MTSTSIPQGALLELEAALRELARGIHPQVLSDRGLDAALETRAGRDDGIASAEPSKGSGLGWLVDRISALDAA